MLLQVMRGSGGVGRTSQINVTKALGTNGFCCKGAHDTNLGRWEVGVKIGWEVGGWVKIFWEVGGWGLKWEVGGRVHNLKNPIRNEL